MKKLFDGTIRTFLSLTAQSGGVVGTLATVSLVVTDENTTLNATKLVGVRIGVYSNSVSSSATTRGFGSLGFSIGNDSLASQDVITSNANVFFQSQWTVPHFTGTVAMVDNIEEIFQMQREDFLYRTAVGTAPTVKINYRQFDTAAVSAVIEIDYERYLLTQAEAVELFL